MKAMDYYNLFIKNVEKKSGLKMSEIRSKDPCEIRKHFDNKFGFKMKIFSEFPYIGCGNVLRDNIYNNKEINKEIDKLIKTP